MPPVVREGYNAKARRLTAGSRKKGKQKKQKKGDITEADPNAEIITPKSAEEKELDKRERLRQELLAQGDNWSSKKKKRLEKYIEKKLKKEERIVIFEKLAKSQSEIKSVSLQSSATLGSGKALTHLERMEKDEDMQVRHALQGQLGKRKRRSGIQHDSENFDGSEDGEEDENLNNSGSESGAKSSVQRVHDSSMTMTNTITRADPVGVSQTPVSVVVAPAAVGSALRRAEDGAVVAPIIRKRSGKKGGIGKWKTQRFQLVDEDSASDTSFDSSDSAYDSASSDEEETGDMDEDDEGHSKEEKSSALDIDEALDDKTDKKKKLGFKEWATNQLSLAKGYVASSEQVVTTPDLTLQPPPKKRKIDESEKMHGPLGDKLVLPETAFAKHVLQERKTETRVKTATVKRPVEVQEARLMLPIVTEEQPIMEAIMLNPVVIICGETGSGKTTQVPQFLHEVGFGCPGSENPGMIGITQPRRVAAISMAKRVAHELSLTTSQVSYQIRYDATVSPSTSIKFMTDGVLLRELATDFLLNKYSVVIIDEAHERSINTDILIGVLSRVVKLREDLWREGKGAKPLRLIIMSATLRVSDFAENKTLFSIPPPIINVAARQHPVTVHFSRRTSPDYVLEAVKKASKIHARLPPGGILIFLTGQNEIVGLCKQLEEKFGRRAIAQRKARRDSRDSRNSRPSTLHDNSASETRNTTINPNQVDVEAEDFDFNVEDAAQVDANLNEAGDVDDDVDDLESEADETINDELGINTEESEVPMHVVPLYSLLPSEKQLDVFKPPPGDARLVVVATNVAETSLTIPGIKYVVDCGRAKERRYDVANGIQAYQISWVSKASAAQRAGRAGRTGPGHCYRLYSSALFEHHFEKFNPPEILRAPIEGVVLQMKNMHIDAVVNFPFPTPPDRHSLQQAEKVLTHLGALKKSTTVLSQTSGYANQITDLGRAMALFPLAPRYSRMLAAGRQHKCLPYVIALVSAMSVGDPFLHEEAIKADDKEDSDYESTSHLTGEAAKRKEIRRLKRKAYFQSQLKHASLGEFTSDLLKILSVVGAYEYHGGGISFCADHFVRPKAMEEIHKLRAQISNVMQLYFPDTNANFTPKIPPPSKIQIKVLKQLVTAAFIDQVAVRKDRVDNVASKGPQYSNCHGVAYRALGIREDVYIHPSSLLADRPPPNFVVYQEVVRTACVYLKGLTVINPTWLSSLGRATLCTFSKPFKRNDGTLMTIPRFGPENWELPPIQSESVLNA